MKSFSKLLFKSRFSYFAFFLLLLGISSAIAYDSKAPAEAWFALSLFFVLHVGFGIFIGVAGMLEYALRIAETQSIELPKKEGGAA
jgi:hypothetical protein